jgi:hypothetical protein
MSEHTPWEARPDTNDNDGSWEVGYTTDQGSKVLIAHGLREESARLIAAAPDLLGALRFILAFYEPGQRYLDTNAWKNAEAAARAAVAKAEGRA